MKQSLTRLQRGVIQRLQLLGFENVAEEARRQWSDGLPYGRAVECPDRKLMADFAKADAQASGGAA
jgi:hypothetical protein